MWGWVAIKPTRKSADISAIESAIREVLARFDVAEETPKPSQERMAA